MTQDKNHKQRFRLIIVLYPIALLAASIIMNVLFWGVRPAEISLPTNAIVLALGLATLLLVINHSWLMTSTELTRLNYDLYATPEEWQASGHDPQNVSKIAADALARNHNAHRNATENTVYFVCAAFVFSLVSPPPIAALTWLIGFAVGRVGHAGAYLAGKDGVRGIFMSVSLVSLYGLCSYFVISLVI